MADAAHARDLRPCRRPTARCCSAPPRRTARTGPTGRSTPPRSSTCWRLAGGSSRLRREHAMKTFAANRPASDQDYRLERDRRVRTSSTRPASARPASLVAGHRRARPRPLAAVGAAGRRAPAPRRVEALEPIPRLLYHPRPEELFALDPRYGQVVCACEQVTAAEIAARLRRRYRRGRWRVSASGPGRSAAAARAPSAWPAARSCARCTRRPGRGGSGPSRRRRGAVSDRRDRRRRRHWPGLRRRAGGIRRWSSTGSRSPAAFPAGTTRRPGGWKRR